jgi:phosphoribosylanthranilate isomerase
LVARSKFCGMTRREDIDYAIQLGVDAIGVILAPQSKRVVTIEKAESLLLGLPPFVDTVAVVLNPTTAFVEDVIKRLPINYLQFHGDESPTFCAQFQFPYIKAIAAESRLSIDRAITQFSSAQAILLDTPSGGSSGGSGQVFDWTRIPQQDKKPLILAGGLNAKNIQTAVIECRPYAVDVSSGIEQAPGKKDRKKMLQFVERLHAGESDVYTT